MLYQMSIKNRVKWAVLLLMVAIHLPSSLIVSQFRAERNVEGFSIVAGGARSVDFSDPMDWDEYMARKNEFLENLERYREQMDGGGIQINFGGYSMFFFLDAIIAVFPLAFFLAIYFTGTAKLHFIAALQVVYLLSYLVGLIEFGAFFFSVLGGLIIFASRVFRGRPLVP